MIINRIEELIKEMGLAVHAFEKSIGASEGTIRRAIKNNTDIQSKWIEALAELYPNIDLEWLLTGKGSVFKSEYDPVSQPSPVTNTQSITKGVPLIPVEALAGWGQGDITILDYETRRYIVPEFDDMKVDFIIRVKGSSMYPHYSSGDLVACKKVASSSFFQWNKVYVLDTSQGAMIKRIKPSIKEGHLTCISDNPKFDAFEIPIAEIHAYALVVGVIRLE